jgi:hypothetical protein
MTKPRSNLKRVRAATGKGMVRTTAALPEALHRRLMVASIETRLVATEIIRRAVAEWLGKYEKRVGRRSGQ